MSLDFLFRFLEYVRKYATEDALRDAEMLKQDSQSEKAGTANGNNHSSTNNLSSDSESSMSDFSEDEARDMEL
jgi:ubiquitin-conjugating enzyme E2 H